MHSRISSNSSCLDEIVLKCCDPSLSQYSLVQGSNILHFSVTPTVEYNGKSHEVVSPRLFRQKSSIFRVLGKIRGYSTRYL